MVVEDTFHFENGSTAFAGMIETESDFTGPCDGEVILDNEVKAPSRHQQLSLGLFFLSVHN
jgi:hypothetical protein